MTYCMNAHCPFNDCTHHATHAPKGVRVSLAWLDGTCRRYISYLVDLSEEGDNYV